MIGVKNIVTSVVLGVFFSCFLSLANIGTYGFSLFPNDYFVETGTYTGDGLNNALGAGIFRELFSIEANASLVNRAKHRFGGFANVHIFHGDSKDALWGIIKDLDRPITFWLDAHIYPPLANVKNCPLIEELEQIKRHPIKTHTILIDDMSCCGTAAFDGLTRDDLIKKIREINPNYIVKFLPGGDNDEVVDNVLWAYVG